MRTVMASALVALAFASALSAASGAAPAVSIAATPIPAATAVRVDGDLNDAIWQTVPAITGFRQREPNDGAAPTYETEARIAYDATSLHCCTGIRSRSRPHCRDPHPPRRGIAIRLGERADRFLSR